jgi:hypothetical protein
MSNHSLYKHSITCQITDEVVLGCIRAICQYCEKSSTPQIGWGGTGLKEWKENGQKVTFRFTSKGHRERFIQETNRLFSGFWINVASNDNDPATPQR